MRKRICLILIAGLTLTMIMSGCGNGDSEVSSDSKVTSTSDTNQQTETTVSESTTVKKTVTSTTTKPSKGESIIGNVSDLRTEYKRLPNFEKLSQAQLEQVISRADITKLSISKDKAHIAKGANAAIKFEYISTSSWAQTIFAKKLDKPLSNGAGETFIIDPVEEPLDGYKGLRFWIDLTRPEGKATEKMELVFFMGNWSAGYRSDNQYTVTLPDNNYKGYITLPFDKFVNGYKPDTLQCNKTTIDYFAFKLLTPNVKDTVIYISGFQAYREVF
ncbi:MAG: hypothetical protein PHH84_03065 [Oscillospiraceae bacterium]|nr:hypothetical protein [Oscillospiraceae bacterium]MDD4545707.1 hypothetical protein [Oscillospiraceae bacterium]